MEWFLSLFVIHDTLVVSLLVVAITIVVVLLLLMSQKSPDSVVKSEIGGTDNVEGALRRVLGEQRWLQAGAGGTGTGAAVDELKLSELESEVLEKDRKIAELNKKLTQGGAQEGGDSGSAEDNSELLERLAEMEARLQEYEIIEDDIADLSLYKTENEKLKSEIADLKSKIGGASEAPVEDPTPIVEEAPVEAIEEPVERVVEEEESEGVDGADLVAEFEKVVNSQSELETDEPSSKVSIKGDVQPGSVVVTGVGDSGPRGQEVKDDKAQGSVQVKADKAEEEAQPMPVHPKLENVDPDSKEEAEVFISELKSLKTIKKTSEES